ncbi:MAG TPA: FAD-dependent oxidoreductase, partial [Bdellovibrionales bacterium]|nr:FAD-dependent oxidoreductase [Bdellovibrionales bacterium]
TRIVLVEAGPRILAAFPEKLSNKATEALIRLGVDVRTGTKVENISGNLVSLAGGETLESCNILWAAGVMASPAGRWLGAPTDRSGRVMVNPDLSVPGLKDVYVIGDAAHFPTADGRGLPGVAQVAIQQGQFVGGNLRRRLSGAAERARFEYRDKGNMATIGRSSAIADIGRFEFAGFFAWLLWCFIHVAYLIGFRSRAIVMIQWAWAYITFQRGARLITRF